MRARGWRQNKPQHVKGNTHIAMSHSLRGGTPSVQRLKKEEQLNTSHTPPWPCYLDFHHQLPLLCFLTSISILTMFLSQKLAPYFILLIFPRLCNCSMKCHREITMHMITDFTMLFISSNPAP